MVERSSSFISRKEEEAPLVLHDDLNPGPSRLINPTTDYESQSQIHQQKPEKKITNLSTMMHLLKGNIGTGILAMPKAVSNAGLLVGTIGIPTFGVLCVHCMHILVNTSKSLARRLGRDSVDYATTAEMAFALGPERTQKFSKTARAAVNFMLTLTQFGFCCVYFLFVGKSINEVVENVKGYEIINWRVYITGLLPVLILFNFIKSLDSLSYASSVANVLQVSGLFMILYYLLKDLPPVSSVPAVAPISKMPLFFGTAMYAFEGIGVVLPIENKMATPDAFRSWNGVLNTVMVIVTCLYTAVGFYGYLKYGSAVQGSITFNLAAPVVSEVVRILFAAAIFLSHPLQLYVAIEIFWPYFGKKIRIERFSSRVKLIIQLLFRAVLVTLTFLFAVSIPFLGLFISLVGALASSSLSLIFPPIIELVTIWNSTMNKRYLYILVVKDFFIMSIGIIGCGLGSYTSIKEIVHCMHNSSDVSCDS